MPFVGLARRRWRKACECRRKIAVKRQPAAVDRLSAPGTRGGRRAAFGPGVDRASGTVAGRGKLAHLPTQSRVGPHAPIPRPDGTHSCRRRGEARPHRHRHAVGVRPSDALQADGRLPDAHHQEAAPEVDRLRVALVPRRRHQHQIPEGSRGPHLGRMGRRARRPRTGVRPTVALVAGQGRQDHRSDQPCHRHDQAQSGFAAADRHRLESGRRRQDGAAALPLPVSVLCRQRQIDPASSISARPTSSSGCLSTSRPTRC